jgi:hypothetical protein
MKKLATQICGEVAKKDCEEGVTNDSAFNFVGGWFGCSVRFAGSELEQYAKHKNLLSSRRIED